MRRLALGIATTLILAGVSAPAAAELRFKEGMWRVEVTGGAGLHSGTEDRTGDRQLTATVEYEIPTFEHVTLGLRLLPALLYDQDEGDTVFGAGVGMSTRLYLKKDYRGLYAEAEGHMFGNIGDIEANSSNINFLIGFGVGYAFKNNWHTVLKYEHISNASIGDENAGANTIGIGIGYRF